MLLVSGCESSRTEDQGQPENKDGPPFVGGFDIKRPGEPGYPGYGPGYGYAGEVILVDGKARVAILLPLSGRAARVGRALRNAAEMALFEFGSKNVELRFYDTGGTPEGAASAAQITAIRCIVRDSLGTSSVSSGTSPSSSSAARKGFMR